MSITDQSTQIPTGTWSLDPVHSSIGFAVTHSGVMTFRGTFKQLDAKLVDGRLEGTVEVASVVVDDENLAGHLQTPDFFDAERNPELSFESSEIEVDGSQLTIRGGIRIKGVERPVELTGRLSEPMSDAYGRERLGLKLETTVDRTNFGVDWNAPLPSGEPALASEVKIAADLYFVREA
jgi:polyisoprenoid-binding protein YceI